MRRAPWLGFVLLLATTRAASAADLESGPASGPTIAETVTPVVPEENAPHPRLKLSFVRFSIGNLDGSAVPLDALHLDLYPLSRRWIRAGFELEGGLGDATFMGDRASLADVMLGVNAGLQWPGRVTPFVEGRLAGGALSGHTEGPITVDGLVVTQASATTYLYVWGIDAGAEVYLIGRSYLSVSLGWLHSTWRGAEDASPPGASAPDIALTDIVHDSFVFKLGVGI
ncbi:MAG TPA: hypothetical protein VH853_05585 [Polyangia bacterium]|jgi:hypothetical protein|nr:hypothetical protein [Polyangia bacterium]